MWIDKKLVIFYNYCDEDHSATLKTLPTWNIQTMVLQLDSSPLLLTRKVHTHYYQIDTASMLSKVLLSDRQLRKWGTNNVESQISSTLTWR